ncbi:TPM domain-containing protein [Treponema sp. R80B11-R83G3]
MKTKLIKLFLTAMIVFFASSVFAQERVVDNANILSSWEKDNLKSLISSISSMYDFDLVIVTENDIGAASPMAYADDFFDYKGYGLGQDRDGCLFLLVTGSRDYWFSTSGTGIKIYTSTAIQKLKDDIVKLLRKGSYYDAFQAFLNDSKEFLALNARGGRSYNFFHRWNYVSVLVAWLASLLIGFMVVQSWKRKMNTALPQTQAAAYVVPGSLAFNVKTETFLYSIVNKSARSDDNSRGGGSHTSSSGRSHGGGGGRY